MSSIKGMSRKKFPLDRTPRRFLSRDPALCPGVCPPDWLERFVVACLPFPWLSSSGGDDANRVLNLASGPGICMSTMVLLEARGLSLFLVIRGGIACISDSVPEHTGPNSLTDTHLEPSVSRTRPTTTRGESPEMERPLPQRRSSFLPMQLCGVEIHSFLPNR
jgi:hypothetical protein